MKHILWSLTIGSVVVGVFFVALHVRSSFIERQIDSIQQQIEEIINDRVLVLGSDGTLPFAGSTYTLSGSGVASSDTSITLTSLTIPQSGQKVQDSDLSSTFYLTLEPGSRTRQEIVACTTVTQNSAGTATLSGCSRGMSPIPPYTASSTLRFAHAGGTSVVFSNAPQLYNDFAARGNDEDISGLWIFSSLVPGVNNSTAAATSGSQFATRDFAISLSIGQAVPAATNSIGYVEIGTASEMASSSIFWSANSTTTVDARNALHVGMVNIGQGGGALWSTSSIVGTDIGFGSRINPQLIATGTNAGYLWGAASTTHNNGTTTFLGNIQSLSPASTTWGYTAIDQSASDAYAVHLNPNPGTYAFGMRIFFKPNATNTAESTLNVNGLGAQTIKVKGVDTKTGDLVPNVMAEVIYDGANFILINPQEGAVTLSTQVMFSSACLAANLWKNFSIGHIVGSTTAEVSIRIVNDAGNTSYVAFRTGGSTASTTGGIAIINNANQAAANVSGVAIVKTSATGTIDFACGNEGGAATTLNGFIEGFRNN